MNSPFQALRLITRLSSALASVSNRHTTQRFYSSSMAASSEFHALSTQTIKGEPYDFALSALRMNGVRTYNIIYVTYDALTVRFPAPVAL